MCQPQSQAENHRKRVVVLVSTLGVNRMYRARQNRAISVLKARGFPFEVVNGADPEQKQRRNEMFRVSGSQTYPQFFLAQKQGSFSFLGDFGILEKLQEADCLPTSVLEGNPTVFSLKGVLGNTGRKRLIFLSTSLRINPGIVQKQERAVEMLAESGVSFDTVDGSDPSMKNRRDELFKISGRRGVYPQFFVYDEDIFHEDEIVTSLGDWESIEAVNDASGLSQETLEAHPSIKTWDAIMGSRVVEGVGSGMASV